MPSEGSELSTLRLEFAVAAAAAGPEVAPFDLADSTLDVDFEGAITDVVGGYSQLNPYN